MKGPSVTLGFPAENDTRAPVEGGWRPSSASSTPAFCRDSLYFIMAETALGSGMVPGSAFSYPLGIISIIKRIVISPFELYFRSLTVAVLLILRSRFCWFYESRFWLVLRVAVLLALRSRFGNRNQCAQ